MAKPVGQDDLRKLMQKIKSTKSTQDSRLKKYKLGSKELALIEEQKRREAEEKLRSQKEKVKPLPRGFFDAKPVKSILKKSSNSVIVPQVVPVPSTSSSVVADFKRKGDREEEEQLSKKAKVEDNDANLPEGFFDDPVQDAKARHIEYKDPADEEWERFQKEITQEIDTAQELVTEEQQEATIERQIEEVDEQLKAWSKVSTFEKKLQALEKQVQQRRSRKQDNSDSSDVSDSGEVDDDDLFDWRKKC